MAFRMNSPTIDFMFLVHGVDSSGVDRIFSNEMIDYSSAVLALNANDFSFEGFFRDGFEVKNKKTVKDSCGNLT